MNRQRLHQGLDYLSRGYRSTLVLAVLALAALLVVLWKPHESRARPRVLIHASVLVGWSAYLAVVGGDIFPGWRQLLFVFVPLCSLVASGGDSVAAILGHRRPRVLFAVTIVTMPAIAALHFVVQRGDSENHRASDERWEWDGRSVGTALKKAFGSAQPLLAVDAAGALPYWSDLPSLDMLGLNDAYISHNPPATFGHGEIGHELGDGAYVWSREPDLIAFNSALGNRAPRFLSGRQLLTIPQFWLDYQWIHFSAAEHGVGLAELWVRREGGRLGIVRGPDSIDVPGYLLTGQESDAVARPDPENPGLIAVLSEAPTGVVPPFSVPAGRWRVVVEPPDARGRAVAVRCDGRTMERLEDSPDLVIDLDEPRMIGVAVAAPDAYGATIVRSIAFRRERSGTSGPAMRCAVPGAPVHVSEHVLSRPKHEHLPWEHPSNVVVDYKGLALVVETSKVTSGFDISADGNDEYAIDVRRGETSLWHGEVGPRRNCDGLAVYRLSVAESLLLEPGDEIAVSPESGDGRFSVGHLTW